MLVHLFAGRAMTNFQPPDGVVQCRKTVTLASFHQPFLDLQMYVFIALPVSRLIQL